MTHRFDLYRRFFESPPAESAALANESEIRTLARVLVTSTTENDRLNAVRAFVSTVAARWVAQQQGGEDDHHAESHAKS